jgi:acyl-CoA synthetase (AMP-forming)/AMP-acid ligase II
MVYLDNEKATRETFNADSWPYIGDQGATDEEGMIHVLDRIKEMIGVKGIGVAVMGVKDDYAGELPKAFVVLKSGVEANEKVGKVCQEEENSSEVGWPELNQLNSCVRWR